MLSGLRGLLASLAVVGIAMGAGNRGAEPRRARAAAITIDYPEDGSIFPPEITPPVFLWRDGAPHAAWWRIEVTFGDGAAGIQATSRGAPPTIGAIDPDCVAATNEPGDPLDGSLQARNGRRMMAAAADGGS